MVDCPRKNGLSAILFGWVSRPWLPMVREDQEVDHGDRKSGRLQEMAWTDSH